VAHLDETAYRSITTLATGKRGFLSFERVVLVPSDIELYVRLIGVETDGEQDWRGTWSRKAALKNVNEIEEVVKAGLHSQMVKKSLQASDR
jgi:hypothetical protein